MQRYRYRPSGDATGIFLRMMILLFILGMVIPRLVDAISHRVIFNEREAAPSLSPFETGDSSRLARPAGKLEEGTSLGEKVRKIIEGWTVFLRKYYYKD